MFAKLCYNDFQDTHPFKQRILAVILVTDHQVPDTIPGLVSA